MSRTDSSGAQTRRSFLFGGTLSLAAAAASPALSNAPAILSGKGDFRTLALVNNRTGENLDAVYWIEGAYIQEALSHFNYILRDWRAEMVCEIDPSVLDVLAATHRLLETSEPFEIISGYRSHKTNAMLRRRSRGVARNSYHIKGMAVDVTLKSRSSFQVSSAAKSLSAGGVGRYRRSNFTHVDSGPVRSWGR